MTISSENTSQNRKYPDITKIDTKELSIELVKKFIMTLKMSAKNRVITPINLMALNGAPVSNQAWILQQKKRIHILKNILVQLEEMEILTKRKSKQGFLGRNEIGYDIV